MGLALWTLGVIGIAIVAYLFMLFAFSSMEEPKGFIYYSEIEKPKPLKGKKLSKKPAKSLARL